MTERVDWAARVQKGVLASGIDPADRRGHKNRYIDLLQKMALQEVLELRGEEVVLDFGCGSGRISYWIAPKVKHVVGLEVTAEMIELAETERRANNVEFNVYDGIHFPAFSHSFDLILSVGVLQIMEKEHLLKTLSSLSQCLKKSGRFYLIEQASDDPGVNRPTVEDYLQAFQESKLKCLEYYPVRNGRWWVLYLIRYGLIPESWFPRVASHELRKRRGEKGRIRPYKDFLFLLKKE